MSSKMTSRDLALSAALAIAGAAAITFAVAHRWNPQELNPGVEGCLTAGVVAFILTLLHRLPYGSAVALTAPIVALEYTATAVAGGPAMGVVGVQLTVMGLLGLVLGFTREEPARASQGHAPEARAHGRRRACAPGAAGA